MRGIRTRRRRNSALPHRNARHRPARPRVVRSSWHSGATPGRRGAGGRPRVGARDPLRLRIRPDVRALEPFVDEKRTLGLLGTDHARGRRPARLRQRGSGSGEQGRARDADQREDLAAGQGPAQGRGFTRSRRHRWREMAGVGNAARTMIVEDTFQRNRPGTASQSATVAYATVSPTGS